MSKTDLKAYLGEYRQCMSRIFRLKEEMQRFTASAACIEKEIQDCIDRSFEIERLINNHKNFAGREILIRRFIYGNTIEQIADILCYSPRHVQRLLNEAIEELGAKL